MTILLGKNMNDICTKNNNSKSESVILVIDKCFRQVNSKILTNIHLN